MSLLADHLEDGVVKCEFRIYNSSHYNIGISLNNIIKLAKENWCSILEMNNARKVLGD